MPVCLALLAAAGLAAFGAACGLLYCLACLISAHDTLHEDEP